MNGVTLTNVVWSWFAGFCVFATIERGKNGFLSWTRKLTDCEDGFGVGLWKNATQSMPFKVRVKLP